MDQKLQTLIQQERQRQSNTINLIASENYASPAVLVASASVLTNKYAEGYPGKRYYAGCEVIDQIECLAQERAKQLFHAEYANVQPHSGSQANMAAYFALLDPGDTVLAMDLSAGGHLTHGYPRNASGAFYRFVHYQVDPQTEQIDYQQVVKLAKHHKPKLIVAGASAYARTIDYVQFRTIADSVGALLLVDMAHIAGLVAANLHPSPIPYADIVTSTTHKTLRGPRGGLILSKKEHAAALDKAVMPGTQGGPLMHIIAAKAAAFFEAAQPPFIAYQQQVINNCQTLATTLQNYGYRIISGGTDTHQCTVDLQTTGISGAQAEKRLASIGITVNRNCIPFDPAKPWITSGIRLGTPAITTRGAQHAEIEAIAQLIHETLSASWSESYRQVLANRVTTLAMQLQMPKETRMEHDKAMAHNCP